MGRLVDYLCGWVAELAKPQSLNRWGIAALCHQPPCATNGRGFTAVIDARLLFRLFCVIFGS